MKIKQDRREFMRMAAAAGLGFSTMSYGYGEGVTNDYFPGGLTDESVVFKSRYWDVMDAHCVTGRHQRLRAGELFSADDLIAEMDHYAISEAIVVDSLSRENHPVDGNRRIVEATRNSPRLHRGWSILPSWLKETNQTPEVFLEDMKQNNVRAIYLYPDQFSFRLADWSIDAILEPLAAEKIPVFINQTETNGRGGADATVWDEVVELCKRWPTLPVVISERRIRRTQRILYQAFDACPNLHLELSAYWLHRGIEYITRNWGAERLVFGSGWPKYGQHMTLVNLTTAQIPEADKQLIAGDNLRRLISWKEPVVKQQVRFPEAADEYVEYGRTGVRPPAMKFHDVHGHLGEYNAHYHVPNAKIEKVVADVNYYGMEKVCVFSFSGVYSDEKFGNDIVSKAAKQYPERLIGFTMLNPLRGEEEIREELDRGKTLGMRGIKLIPTLQGYQVDGPLIDVPCQWAQDHKQIIINHDWGPAAQMERLVATYPDACFVTAHTTTAYAAIMKKYNNLYVCSCPLLTPRACEEVVREIGADRLLFGSDLLDLPMGWGLGPVVFARISREEKKLILGDNLKRLLQKYSLPEK